MFLPVWSRESPEDPSPEETGVVSRAPADRDSSKRSLKVSVQLEMTRSESRKAVQTGWVTAQVAAGRTFVGRYLGRLRRALRPAVAGTAPSQPPASRRPPRPDRAASRDPGGHRPGTPGFWDALSQAEQEALTLIASLGVFAPGDRLMGEGDQADYVMVIIDGRTRVCVDENGWERVLAERGPGELIGERGGLQVRVRSASVIAMEAVRVLVVRTDDFAAFVDDHPRVLDIVESQLYDRLTESPAGYQAPTGNIGPEESPAAVTLPRARPATVPFYGAPVANDAAPLLLPLRGQNCTILFSDVVAFSSRDRNDEDRLIIRRALLGMTGLALQGIPDAWSQDRGDGLLTVIPPAVPPANVIELLHKQLPPALARHNSTDRKPTRFQLRIAINVGPVTSDTIGVSGEAIIIAARLLEAPLFKKAMTESSANFGIIASPFVYDTVIRHSLPPIDLAGYSRIQAIVKEVATPAWMKLFDVPVSTWYSSPSAVADSFGAPLTTCSDAAEARI